jgi:prepilin peptidase dependent protein B
MKRQAGFTLVEIMIALVLGLVVVGGGITIYGLSIRGSSDTIKSVRLNYDLDSLMALIVNDLRRAGYWSGATADADDLTSNPFTSGTTDIQILNGGNCVLYTYDANGNASVDSNEFYGFRLSGTSVGVRLTGSTTADCDSDGSWETLTVDNGHEPVAVTALQFSFDSKCVDKTNHSMHLSTCADAALTSGVSATEIRQVNIVLSGQIATDPNFTKTLTDTVKVRNDRVFIQP